jgi:hypothetical protein
VPTFKPDRAEMRRIQATIRECSNCRSIIWLTGGLEMPDTERLTVADGRDDLFVT